MALSLVVSAIRNFFTRRRRGGGDKKRHAPASDQTLRRRGIRSPISRNGSPSASPNASAAAARRARSSVTSEGFPRGRRNSSTAARSIGSSKASLAARQRLLEIEPFVGDRWHRSLSAPARSRRRGDPALDRCVPFQGWRYFADEDAPADLAAAGAGAADMPEELRRVAGGARAALRPELTIAADPTKRSSLVIT